MDTVVWKESYSIGIPEIDQQHRDFVRLINRLAILHNSGDNPSWVWPYLLEIS